MVIMLTPRTTTSRGGDTRSRVGTSSSPPPPRLTGAQLRDLESELLRELAALERRRLTNEQADESAEVPEFAVSDGASARLRASDIVARRDAVTDALARLRRGAYGTCARCAAPIPFGRLLAMPDVTHCLTCSGHP